MKKAELDVQRAYFAMAHCKERFGTFHKIYLHIHTPESYDYNFLDDWKIADYKKASDQDIFDIGIKRGLISKQQILEDFDSFIDFNTYKSRKEVLSFLSLAYELMRQKAELVVVTDHHTIAGIPKLEKAIQLVSRIHPSDVYPEVILGIEISCADKNHVVGIFEYNDANIDVINNWLGKYLVNKEEGSYETSKNVLQFISSNNGLGYIAHIDTSDIFKEKYLSGGYKKELFSDKSLQFLGLSRYDAKAKVETLVERYKNKDIKYILDNDSHDIDSLGNKYFWIKGSKCNYKMLREAFHDYDVSVSFNKNTRDVQFIKGIFVEHEPEGFLSGSNGSGPFCLNFSNALNCFIGGRGTGKSSVLEMLEYVLSQRCTDERLLDFLCAHGNTWILYYYQNREYLIEMRLPVKENKKDNILRCFGYNESNRYNYPYNYDEKRIEDYSYRKLLTIYEVALNEDGELWLDTVSDKKVMRRKFFDTHYSVNTLVSIAGSRKINIFLYEILLSNQVLSHPNLIKVRTVRGLRNKMEEIKIVLAKRKEEVENVIKPFNEQQKDMMRIIYSQNSVPPEPNFERWLFDKKYNANAFYKGNLKQRDTLEYLLALYDRLNVFDFIEMVLNKDTVQAQSTSVNLSDFCTPINQDLIDQGIEEIIPNSESKIIFYIFDKLINNNNISIVLEHLDNYVKDIEKFSLEFNINNKESSKNDPPIYKDTQLLSLGQKVVAMLSFIIGYSEYSNDYRPLIIDQPEDNLDNQYIYKNLVKQLKDVKEKRQVIIATHSATIVTNAKADQVCVMESDSVHGWIEATGYPNEKRIKKHIINYLEGGRESFLHKQNIYKDALEST